MESITMAVTVELVEALMSVAMAEMPHMEAVVAV